MIFDASRRYLATRASVCSLVLAFHVALGAEPATAGKPVFAIPVKGTNQQRLADSIFNRAFAVLEFDMPDAKNPAEDWALGLADLMEAALQDRQLMMFTRRYVSLILNERRVIKSGLVGDAGLVRLSLPDVDFLVKGTVSRKENDHFELAVTVLDAHSGAERQAFSGTGKYPEDVVNVLDGIAGKVSAMGGAPVAPPSARVEFPGFTRIPEVAVLFYRGIEHYMAGRPTYAVDCFRTACDVDPAFPVAILWHMRAYDALGLKDHAALEYERLLQRQKDLKTDIAGPDLVATDRRQVVTVLFLNQEWPFDAALVTQVKDRLRKDERISLFTPDWLHELVNEQDLRMSGEFGLLQMAGNSVWLQAEYAVILASEGTKDNRRIRARVVNLLKGQTQGECHEKASAVDALCQSIAAILRQPPHTVLSLSSEGHVPTASAATTNWPASRGGGLRNGGESFAQALDCYSRSAGQRSSQLKMFARYPHSECEHRVLLMTNLLAGIRSADPDAATWRAYAKWNILFALREGRHPTPPLQEYFADVLKESPDSLAAACIKYSIAHEMLWHRQNTDAYPYLLSAAERICAAASDVHVDDRFDRPAPAFSPQEGLPGVLFLTAYVSWQNQDLTNAKKYMELFQRAGGGDYHGSAPGWLVAVPPGVSPEPYVSGDGMLFFGYGWGATLNGVFYQSLDSAVTVLSKALESESGETLSLEELWHKVEEGKPPEVIECGRRYYKAIQSCIEEGGREAQLQLFVYAPRVLSKLYSVTTNEGFREELRTWGTNLAASATEGDSQFKILMATRNLEKLDELCDQVIATPHPHDANYGQTLTYAFEWKGKLELARKGLVAQAERYEELVTRWRRSPPANCNMWYVEMWSAAAWKKAGDLDRTARAYEMALEDSIQRQAAAREAREKDKNSDYQGKIEQERSMNAGYWLASAEAERGNAVRAAELLKQVIERPESKECELMLIGSSVSDPSSGETSWFVKGKLYAEAVDLLSRIREGK